MTISIDNGEIETLLAELEESTGRGRDTVLLDALRREADLARRIAEGLRIDAEFRQRLKARELIDPRSVDEILAYDENGLPV